MLGRVADDGHHDEAEEGGGEPSDSPAAVAESVSTSDSSATNTQDTAKLASAEWKGTGASSAAGERGSGGAVSEARGGLTTVI